MSTSPSDWKIPPPSFEAKNCGLNSSWSMNAEGNPLNIQKNLTKSRVIRNNNSLIQIDLNRFTNFSSMGIKSIVNKNPSTESMVPESSSMLFLCSEKLYFGKLRYPIVFPSSLRSSSFPYSDESVSLLLKISVNPAGIILTGSLKSLEISSVNSLPLNSYCEGLYLLSISIPNTSTPCTYDSLSSLNTGVYLMRYVKNPISFMSIVDFPFSAFCISIISGYNCFPL